MPPDDSEVPAVAVTGIPRIIARIALAMGVPPGDGGAVAGDDDIR